jgi:hypothetical protein
MQPDYDTAFDKLYLACLWASPGEDVKRGFKELRAELDHDTTGFLAGDETPARGALRVLAGRLYDGLTYGNWPRA